MQRWEPQCVSDCKFLCFPHLLQSDALLACVDDHILGALGQWWHRASCVRTTAAQRPCKMTSRKTVLIITVTACAIIFCQITRREKGGEKLTEIYTTVPLNNPSPPPVA